MSVDYEEQYWAQFEGLVCNVTDILREENDIVTEENSNDINKPKAVTISLVLLPVLPVLHKIASIPSSKYILSQ